MKKFAMVVLVLWSALVCAAFAPFYAPVINIVANQSAAPWTTWSATYKDATVSLSNGNLTAINNGTNSYGSVRATNYFATGFQQYSVQLGTGFSTTATAVIGVLTAEATFDQTYVGQNIRGKGYQPGSGAIIFGGNIVDTFAAASIGDIITIDISSGDLKVLKNGVLIGTSTGLPAIATFLFPAVTSVYNGSAAPFLTLVP